MSNNLKSIVILVLGRTGVGKSTFINRVLRQNLMEVGDQMESCTLNIATAEIDTSQFLGAFPFLENRHLLLVDTPGFDCTFVEDSVNIEKIKNWLKTSGGILGGFICMLDISQGNLMHSVKKKFFIDQVHPESSFDKVILLKTTVGNQIPVSEAEGRLLACKEWKDMIDKGAQAVQYDGTHSSGLKVVEDVLRRFGEMTKVSDLRERMEKNKTPPNAIDKFIKSLPATRYDPSKVAPDIVIPVIGLTGVGKSTFINAVLGQDTVAVGQESESCTADISVVKVDTSKFSSFPWLQKHHLLLVDTQGFDDTFVEDSEILERIAKWLEMSYRAELILGGVVYLHDISSNRFTGTAKKNLAVFNKLCGDRALGKVVLGITMAGRLLPGEAKKRLINLKEKYWKDIIDMGAEAVEFDGNHDSASNLIEIVLGRFEESTVLEIQRELVDKKKIIPETEAGKELRHILQRILDQHRRRSESSGKAAQGDSDTEVPVLNQEQIGQISKQLHRLEVPLLRRLLAIFGFY